MLVLTRRADESIQFPNLGITIRLLRLSPKQARIGIEAPAEFAVVRGELAAETKQQFLERFPKPATQNLQNHVRNAAAVLDKLQQAIDSSQWQDAEPMVFDLFSDLKAMDEQVAALARGAKTAEQRRRKRALVVDDNPNESRLLASYLRLKDIEVDTVVDGGEAVSYLANHSVPDAIVLDMNMPRFDGPWTVRELRSSRQYDQVQIFAVSGMDPDECDVELGPQGVNQWFRKPLNPEDLIREIGSAVGDLTPIA